MDIILVRHGESIGNKNNIVQGQTDNGLSELGKAQATDLSNHFNSVQINAIYSSDLERAIQTAEPTALKLGIKINTDPDLREANFGLWEGMTYEEAKTQYPKEYVAWHENYFVRPKWFESYNAHFLRMRQAIERMLKKHQPSNKVIVFTHGGSIKTQIGFFNNLTGEELAKFRTYNCGLACIKFNPTTDYEKGRLIYYNKIVINTNGTYQK